MADNAAGRRRTPAAPGAVLVVGDANVDLVLTGDVVPRFGQAEQLLADARLTLGGSASIVAAGLGALATPARLAARVGDDPFGEFTVEALRARDVDVALVERVPGVPTAVTVVLSAPDDRAMLTHLGTIGSLRAATISDDLLREVAHVHVASYFLQPDLAAELPDLFARAHAAGATTSLDTNWDPAERWAGVVELLPHVDVLLPNRAELRAIAARCPGATGDDEQLAAALHGHGPVVAVKAGADGAWAATAGGTVRVAAPPATVVVDTTGAGDSFDAGFLAAWVRGLGIEACLRWAVTAGSLSTRALGGTPGQPSCAELAAALAELPATIP